MTELSCPRWTTRLQSLGTSKPGGLRPAPNTRLSSRACSVLGLSQTVVNGKQHLGAGERKAFPASAGPQMEGWRPRGSLAPRTKVTRNTEAIGKNSKAERG